MKLEKFLDFIIVVQLKVMGALLVCASVLVFACLILVNIQHGFLVFEHWEMHLFPFLTLLAALCTYKLAGLYKKYTVYRSNNGLH